MAMGRRAKNRLKMFGLVFCCSSVIAALATSTMAWYAAESSITIDPSSSSVTIRTPFQFSFWAYKGNGFSPATKEAATKGTGYTGSQSGDMALNAIGNYVEVDEIYNMDHPSHKTNLTQVSGLWPRYKMSFAIHAVGLDNGDNPDQPTLKIDTYYPGWSGDRIISTASALYGEKHVCLAEAIDIKAGSGADLDAAVTAAGSASDAMQYSYASEFENNTTPIRNADITLGAQSTKAARQDAGNTTEWWWFYTIEFSDAESTRYVRTSGANTYDEDNTAADVYYYRTTSGNSSVYEGLSFIISQMSLK